MEAKRTSRGLTLLIILSGAALFLLSVGLYRSEKPYKVSILLGLEYQEQEEYCVNVLMTGENPKVFRYKDSTKPVISRLEDEHGSWLRLTVTPKERRFWDVYEIHYQSDQKNEEPNVVIAPSAKGEKSNVTLYDYDVSCKSNPMRWFYPVFGAFVLLLSLIRVRRVKMTPAQEYITGVFDRAREREPENPAWIKSERLFYQLLRNSVLRRVCYEWLIALIYFCFIRYMQSHIFWFGEGIIASGIVALAIMIIFMFLNYLLSLYLYGRFLSMLTEECRPTLFAAAGAEAYRYGRYYASVLGKGYTYQANLATTLNSCQKYEESLKYQTLLWREIKEKKKKSWIFVHYHNLRRLNCWWLGKTEAVLKEREIIWSFLEIHKEAGKPKNVRRDLDGAKLTADIGEKRWMEAREGAVVLLDSAQNNWERLRLYDMLAYICQESGDLDGAKRYGDCLRAIKREKNTARFSQIADGETGAEEAGDPFATTFIRVERLAGFGLIVAGCIILHLLR